MSAKDNLFKNAEYRHIFDDLVMLTAKGKTSQPFIPLIPEDWGSTDSDKIVWYGAATNGWDEGNEPADFKFYETNKKNEDWLEKEFKQRNNRPFWNVQRNCLNHIGAELEQAVWSNVFKVGGLESDNKGIPPKPLQDKQSELCLRAFQIEVDILKPKLVVLHVGSLTDSILHELAGPWMEWKKYKVEGKDVAAHKHYKGYNLIWLSRSYSIKLEDYKSGFKWCVEALKSTSPN